MNLVIECLMKNEHCDIANKMFVKMPIIDMVTWNSIIGGYIKNSRFFDALSLYWRMLNAKVEPDGFTFTFVVNVRARLGALCSAKWVHGLMVDKWAKLNYRVTLIDMYVKCGKIDDVAHNHVSIWNAMISGLIIHELAMDAIVVFSRMERDHVLLDPLEHYGTTIDLMGRARLMEEAYVVTKVMQLEPDVIISRALLSSYRIHRKKEVGEVAIANKFSLESGDFVLLSNLYCSLKNWDSTEKVRQMMKIEGVKKNCGKSWFELGDNIHQLNAAE
ncbi:Pentatricopeptide repeat-containing protein [Spatholobus suberectus]|nr:Pentatricopeptide repeat-containing protein [Spatholobus suberectus]